MDAEVTSAFRDLRDTLLDEMRIGFNGVYARQDKTNGRLLEAEQSITRHDERIKTLFRRLPTRSEQPDDAGDDRQITEREVLIALGAIAITVAVLKFLPTLAAMVKP